MTLGGINFFNEKNIYSLSVSGGGEGRNAEYVNCVWDKYKDKDKDQIVVKENNKQRSITKKELEKILLKDEKYSGLPKTIKGENFYEYIQQTPDNNLVQRHLTNKKGQPLAITTESDLKGYNNYYEYNEQGEKTNFVEYQDNGKFKIQRMHFKSQNGSFSKEIIHCDDLKKMKTTITDKNGKTKTIERTYKNNKDGTATSTINGKKYEISGLNGNKISVKTPSDKLIILDLEKMVEGDDDNEKSKIKEYIKLLPGDVLENLSNEINNVKFYALDSKDGYYDPVKEALWLSGYNDNETTLHELAHAMDAYKGGQHSSSEQYKNIFIQERNNAGKYALGAEIKHAEYLLTNTKQDDTEAYKRKGPFKSNREMFADCYAIMNDMEIGQIAPRQLIIMRAFQGTLHKVDELTQSNNLNSRMRQYIIK